MPELETEHRAAYLALSRLAQLSREVERENVQLKRQIEGLPPIGQRATITGREFIQKLMTHAAPGGAVWLWLENAQRNGVCSKYTVDADS